MQDGIRAMRLAGAGMDILALEDGTGQAISTSSGPVELVSASLLGLMLNLMSSDSWDKETLLNTVEHADAMYKQYTKIKEAGIAKGEDPEVAHEVMVAALNAFIASEAVKVAKENGSLDELLIPKSTLADELGISDKKIITGVN